MRDDNELNDGETRIGHVYGGRHDTPVLGQLERRGNAITLSVYWDSIAAPAAKWFMWGIQLPDDINKTKFDQDVPRLLSFTDERGTVDLVGCRALGMKGRLLGPGRGRIAARYVVFERVATDASYESIHGLRTTLSGLRDWLGVESVQATNVTNDSAGRVQSVAFTMDSPSAMQVPGVDGLTLVPRWTTAQPHADVVELREHLHVETWYDDARPWSDHLTVHRGVRDLLAVSRWHREEFTDAFARADTDRGAEDRRWARTMIPGVMTSTPEPARNPHLIAFSDIGVDGISAWLQLREDYQRAVDPLVSSVQMSDTTIETKVSQVGIGLEALGFLLAVKVDGRSEKQARNENYVDRFTRIATPMSDVLPFSVDDWATEFANAYNAVKHANRTLPDPFELANRWRHAVVVFRAWVALEVGVDRHSLRDRISVDPWAGRYDPID